MALLARQCHHSSAPHIFWKTPTGADEDFQPSSTVILRGVGTAVLEADIRRLVARKIHFPDFRDDNDVVRVIPYRDIKSLDRRPIYHLTFATPAAATSFARSMTPIFSDATRSEWPDVRFPPGSRPEFSRADNRNSSILQQEHVLQSRLATGGSAAGQCVLLTICGVGGRRKSTGKLPRTHDIRIILEEKEVELCRKDLEMGGAGVQRIVQEKLGPTGNRVVVKADGRGLGAEGRWLIRCASESEAHRVVRELHMRAPWEGCGTFRAEVIH
ncbi:hypothetical protein K440DRAFT_108629 [Wilcoxina mikolae CBS 423.85]|nr:hypothetical protein K440DRAFT_108629 [Wilcoxina mikolae CBS 423.85]